MSTGKTATKRVIPPPGRKLSFKEAREHVNKKFGPAFAKLSK